MDCSALSAMQLLLQYGKSDSEEMSERSGVTDVDFWPGFDGKNFQWQETASPNDGSCNALNQYFHFIKNRDGATPSCEVN